MGKFTTLSQGEFDRMSDVALNSQPLRKEVMLSQIEVVKDDMIKYQGRFIKMEGQAFKDLCKIIGMPIGFNKKFKEDFGEKARGVLLNKLKTVASAKGNTSLSLIVNPNTRSIVGVTPKAMDMISNKGFLDSATHIIDKYGLDVNSFSVEDSGSVIINTSSPKNNWGIKGLKDEDFFGGVTFSNSPGKGFQVSPYLHRLICANGMIGKSFEETIKLGNLSPGETENFYTQLNQMAKRGFRPHLFEDKVRQAMNTPASLAEMETAHELIRSLSGSDYADKELEKWVPYHTTRKGFHDAGIDTIIFSKDQKKGARTGTSVWNVVNGMTNFASHDYGFKISDYDRSRIQVQAGNMLSKKAYDIQNVVPSPFTGTNELKATYAF